MRTRTGVSENRQDRVQESADEYGPWICLPDPLPPLYTPLSSGAYVCEQSCFSGSPLCRQYESSAAYRRVFIRCTPRLHRHRKISQRLGCDTQTHFQARSPSSCFERAGGPIPRIACRWDVYPSVPCLSFMKKFPGQPLNQRNIVTEILTKFHKEIVTEKDETPPVVAPVAPAPAKSALPPATTAAGPPRPYVACDVLSRPDLCSSTSNQSNHRHKSNAHFESCVIAPPRSVPRQTPSRPHSHRVLLNLLHELGPVC